MKNIIFFLSENNIPTAVKYCCILHGRVCVMNKLHVPKRFVPLQKLRARSGTI